MEARLAHLIDTAGLAMISCDDHGRIELFNRGAEVIFEMTAAQTRGQDWHQFIIAHCSDDSRDAIEMALQGSLGPLSELWHPVSIIHSEGWLLPCEMHCVNVAVNDQRYLNCYIRSVDAQNRRFREKQVQLASLADLERSNLIAEMASSIAHELNQPLTAITAYLQSSLRLLRSHDGESLQMICSAMEQAIEQSFRASEIIKRMRTLITHRGIQAQPFDVNMLIRGAARIVAEDIRADHIELNLQLGEHLPPVYCDPVDIEQVLLNLLKNSWEAIKRGGAARGSITVSSHMYDETYVQVTVRDTGCGINRDERDTLIRRGLSAQEPVRGIGLPISFSIIEAHAGRLWLDNDMDKGAAFHFTLLTVPPKPLVSEKP